MDRIVVRMDGFPGAPGFMTFYVDDALAAWTSVDSFVSAVAGSSPLDVTFSVPAGGDSLDDVDGGLVGSWSRGSGTTHTGGAPGAYAAPTGACVTWGTGAIVGRRALRGRTFLVPLGGAAFEADGSLAASTLSALRTAANNLVTSGHLLIWHRPTGTPPAGGIAHTATFSNIADRAAVLRSRRP